MQIQTILSSQDNGDTIPIIGVGGYPTALDLQSAENRDTLNLALFEVLDEPVITIELGYEKIRGILEEFGWDASNIPFSTFEDGIEDGEEIYAITDDSIVYLYIAFFVDSQGYYEFHAEIVTEDELNDILSID